MQLAQHEPTVQRMQENYSKRGMELNAARLRMATLPTPAEVLYTEGLWVPLVQLQGIYILPGIPRLFQQMISAHVVGASVGGGGHTFCITASVTGAFAVRRQALGGCECSCRGVCIVPGLLWLFQQEISVRGVH